MQSIRSIEISVSPDQKAVIEEAIKKHIVNNSCNSCNKGNLTMYGDKVVVGPLRGVKGNIVGYSVGTYGLCDQCTDGWPIDITKLSIFSKDQWDEVISIVKEQNPSFD